MQSKSNGATTGMNHISAKQCYVTRLFLSTLALALIPLSKILRTKLAILSAAPVDCVALRDMWIWKRVSHAWLMVRRALV